MHQKMKLGMILVIIVCVIYGIISFSNKKWTGFVYTNGLTSDNYIKKEGFSNFEECQHWALNGRSGSDIQYECGYNCRYETGYNLYICEETRDS